MMCLWVMKDFFFRFPFWSELNWSHLTLEFNLWTPSFPTNLHSFWGPWQPRRRPVVFGAFYEQSEGERKIACCAWRLGQPQPIYTILAAFCSLLKSKSKWHVNKRIFVCELIWTGQVACMFMLWGGLKLRKTLLKTKTGTVHASNLQFCPEIVQKSTSPKGGACDVEGGPFQILSLHSSWLVGYISTCP